MQEAPEATTGMGCETLVDPPSAPLARAESLAGSPAGAALAPESLHLEVFGRRWLMSFHGLEDSVVQTLRHLWARAVVPEGHEVRDEAGTDAEPGARGKRGEQDGAHGIPVSSAEPRGDLAAAPFPVMAAEKDRPAGMSITDGVIVGTDSKTIPYTVSRALTLQAITRRRGGALMLHAVGLCADNGRAVALVAPSGTGKTTAAKRLGRHLGYLSDETVIIEADDRISAYPKPLSIITNPAESWNKHEESPDDLGLLSVGPDTPPPTIAAVVVLRRDPTLAEPTFTMHSLIDAILDVIPETSALPSLPDPLDRLCQVLTKSGGPFLLTHPDIDGCVDFIVGLTHPHPERDTQSPTWVHHPGETREVKASTGQGEAGGAGAAGAGCGGTDGDLRTGEGHVTIRPTDIRWDSVVERATWTDCIVTDDEAVLLQELIPVRLSRMGTILWLHADQPTTVADLHAEVTALIGGHEDSAELVTEAVQVLVDNGLLTIVPDRVSDGC